MRHVPERACFYQFSEQCVLTAVVRRGRTEGERFVDVAVRECEERLADEVRRMMQREYLAGLRDIRVEDGERRRGPEFPKELGQSLLEARGRCAVLMGMGS